MKKLQYFVLLMCIYTGILTAQVQQDTSSYFPLGLWGIWHDRNSPPYTRDLTSFEWGQERDNWQAVNGNYLVAHIPVWVEDTVMTQTEPFSYKMDIKRSSFSYGGQADTSLRYWIGSAPNPLTPYWKQRADEKINGIFQRFGSRAGFHSYFVVHEWDMWGGYGNEDTLRWPAIGYIIDKIKEIDPNHKSYIVHWGLGEHVLFPYNITLPQFAQRFPKLGIYQSDHYVFFQSTPPSYTYQQQQLNKLLISYNDCMNAFKNTTIEWHAVIQTQSYTTELCPDGNRRRPNINELRVQAYLALSRGARGITSFVYGSTPEITLGLSASKEDMLTGGFDISSCGNDNYNGLVDVGRNPYTRDNPDPDDFPAFTNLARVYAELQPIGSVIRKLKVYDAFPNTSIPTGNSVGIYSVTGDKIEIGIFKRVDEGTDSTNYFMVVNRVCNNVDGGVSSPQSINIVLNGYQAIIDKKTNQFFSGTFDATNNRTTFTVSLGPGEGKLFAFDRATQLANYNKSIDVNATALNNQRTLVGEMGSGFHLVFSSGGQIFYRKSNNNGSDWILTRRLSTGKGCKYPAITKIGNTIITVWQQPNGSNYDVVFSRSTDNGSTWSTPQALPQSTNISSLIEGPAPSIVSNTSGKILVVYRQSSNLKFTYSTNYGQNWANLGSVPNTGTTSQRPSLTLLSNGDFLLTYDNDNSVYTQNYYNPSNVWYGGAIEISNHSTSIHEHRYSQVSGLDGQNFIHGVWQGFDAYTTGVNEVIVHRKRSSGGVWSPQTIFRQYGSRLKPTANAHRNTTSGVSIYFQQNIDNPQIRRISSYNGVNWDYAPYGGLGTFIGYGRYVNSLERSYDDNRGIVWTSTNGPVYDVLYNFESEPQRLASNGEEQEKFDQPLHSYLVAGKYTLTDNKGYTYSRRVGINTGNSKLCFEITEPYFITIDNKKIDIPFISLPHSINEDSIGLNGLLGYLSTVNSTISTSIDSIVVDVSAYSSNVRDLVNNRFIFNVFIRDLNSNKTFVIGNLTIESTLPETKESRRFSFAISQIFNGGNVLVGIEAVGLKPNLSNIRYGFANVYTDITTSMKKEIVRREPPKSENLLNNYPNPFNPSTKIKYLVSSPEYVVLKVFDILGREVATLVNEPKQAGEYEMVFDASRYGLSSGVYFYQLSSGSFISTKKFVLSK